MKHRTVIKPSSLPSQPPTFAAIVWWLLLDRLNAPGWAYGVLWTLVAIFFIAWVYRFWTDQELDVPGFGQK